MLGIASEPLFATENQAERAADLSEHKADANHRFRNALALDARAAVDSFDQLFVRTDHRGAGRADAPHAFDKLYMVRFLAELRRQHPKLSIDVSRDDDLTDSVVSMIDVGIRAGAVRDRRFIVRTVASVPLKVVATPALIASAGAPSNLDELKAMPLSFLQDRRTGSGWPWIFPNEESFVPDQPCFTCDDPEAKSEMVLQGMVFAHPMYLAEPHLSKGMFVEVLPEYTPQPLDLVFFRTRPSRGGGQLRG